ncbi:MAG: carbohydrate binding domain-containing protein [Candidatus Saccharimonadales bacterium]
MENKIQDIGVPYVNNRSDQATASASVGQPAATFSPTPFSDSFSPTPTPAAPPPPPVSKPRNFPGLVKRAGIGVLALLLVGGTWLTIGTITNRREVPTTVANRFESVQIPLEEFAKSGDLSLLGTRNLTINGPLKLNDAFILSPSAQPSTGTPGQIYYNQTTNQLSYFNGTEFVTVADSSGTLQGVGSGLALSNGQLSNSGVLALQGQTGNVNLTSGGGIAIDGTTLTNTGVLSIGGQTGDITLGSGLAISNGTLRNSGVNSLASGSASLIVSNDGSGNLTISDVGGGSGTVQSPGGTAGRIAKFTGVQTIADSLLSESGTVVTVNGDLSVTGSLSLSSALGVNSGGTGATSLANNGVVVGQGSGALTAVTAGGAGLCLLSTAGAPAFAACPSSAGVTSVNGLTGALTIANASGAGSTITINDASTVAKGIASFNATNFTASSGAVNTVQDINTTAAPTFGRLTLTSSQASSPMLLVNNTNGAATGNLLDLQQSGVSRLNVTPAGNMTVSGSINGQTISSTANFTGSVAVAGAANLNGGAAVTGTLNANTITPSAAMTVGSTGQNLLLQGNSSTTLTATSGANTTTLAFQAPTANVTYRLLTTGVGTYDICTTAGNCTGVGGGVTTPGGTTNRLAKFTAGQTIADSTITDDGTSVTTSVDLIIQGGDATIGVAASQTGSLHFAHSGSSFLGTIIQGALTANRTYILPDQNGTICLTSGNCSGAGSPNTLQAAYDAGNTILTTDARDLTLTLADWTTDPNFTITTADNSTGFTSFVRANGTGLADPAQLLLVDNLDLNRAVPVGIKIQAATGGITTGIDASDAEIGDALSVGANNIVGTTGNIDFTNFDVVGASGNTSVGGTLAVTGNTTLTGDLAVNGGDITAGGALNITPGGTLTVGATTQTLTLQGGASTTLSATSGANTTTLSFTAPTANTTLRLPALTAGTYDLCTSSGNCAGVGATLQTAYNNAAGGTTPEIKLDSTRAGLDIQDADTTIAANLLNIRASNGAGLGNILLGVGNTGQVTLQNSANSTAALRVLNAASNALLTVDTTNNQTIINGTGINGAGGRLQFGSGGLVYVGEANTTDTDQLQLSGWSGIYLTTGLLNSLVLDGSGSATFQAANSTTALRVLNGIGSRVATVDTTNGQLVLGESSALSGKLVFANATNANAITLISATATANRTVTFPDESGTVCLSTGNCAGAGGTLQTSYTNSVGGTTPEIKLDATRGAIDIQDANSTIGANLLNVRASNGAGLGNILFGVGNTGQIAFQNSADSVNALRVLNATGSSVLNVDTTNQRVGVGGTAAFSKFEVIDGDAAIYNNGNNPRLILGDSTTAGQNGYLQWDSTNDYFRIETAGTNGLKIKDNFVAIGNLFPDQPLKIGNGSTLLAQVNTTGQALFQNSTDSSTAFRILNAASGELVGLNSSDSILSLFGNNTGHIAAFATNANSLSGARESHGVIAHQGYLYALGGCDGAGARTNTAQYAPVNGDGSIGVWGTTTALTNTNCNAGFARYDSYIYVAGGTSSASTADDIYMGRTNRDGTISSWRTLDVTLPTDLRHHTMTAYNGYLYVIGGQTLGSVNNQNIYYARINSDGTIGSFSTLSSWLPTVVNNGSIQIANGYLYVAGGRTNTGTAAQSTLYYGKINADGTIAAATTGAIAAARYSLATAVANGYMYVLGGIDGTGTTLGTVHYAPLNNDGSVGSWTTDSTALTAARSGMGATVINGYIYAIGGYNAGAQSNVWYASGTRVKVGASLDLLGYSGEGMADGSSAGTLTAGNTFISGNLHVSGEGMFRNGAVVNSNLSVNGLATIRTTTDSTNALQVVNAAGQQLLSLSTIHNVSDLVTNGSIEISSTNWAGKGGATVGRVTTQSYVGQASLETLTSSSSANSGAQYNVTLTASTQYAASFYAKLSSGTLTTMRFGYSSDGTVGGETDCKSSQTVATGGWTRYECTFTTAGIISGTPYFYFEDGDTGTARTVWIDALQIVQASNIGAFFDGKLNSGALAFTGPVAVQNDNDSTNVLQVHDASGQALFGVDAVNKRVGIGSITPGATLDVNALNTTSTAAIINQNAASTMDILSVRKGGTEVMNIAQSGVVFFQTNTNSTTAFRILNSSAASVFTVNTVDMRVLIGGGDVGADGTPALVILDHKNTSGDPTGVNGGMYYNSNTGKFRCYEGGAWKNCLGMNESANFNSTNGAIWTNMPAALTEFLGQTSSRTKFDLSDAAQVRLVANVKTAGATGSELRVQYSTDQSTWNYLDGGTGPSTVIDTTGLKVSSWVTVTGGAKSDVFLRVVGITGDAIADPEFGLVELQIR